MFVRHDIQVHGVSLTCQQQENCLFPATVNMLNSAHLKHSADHFSQWFIHQHTALVNVKLKLILGDRLIMSYKFLEFIAVTL